MKILIADDAAFMRMRLRKLLEEAGHTVLEATNGEEAVAMYREQNPAVVLMDITMPEMDGVTATRHICQSDPKARVIMVSALGQQAMIVSAIQAGAKDFVVKPYEVDRVLGAINKWAQ
ncbi:MAG: two-component system response regulator [Sulfobacillus acidophilus]|uniref:Stage 0 sporulation protein A homolog n=1 Tax=Sulfobacillus acidophilus TaxID=53633 RepID=A0A2T2WKN0_9FIRM|nr:MAG: two-component system response regulator [Sulfobacillus acidophilus]